MVLFFMIVFSLENNSNLKEHIRLVEKNLKQLKEPSGKTKSIYKVRIIQEVDSEKDLVTDYIPKLPTDKLLFNGNIYSAKSKKGTTKWILDEEKYSKGDKALFIGYLTSKEYEFNGNKWIYKKNILPHIQFLKNGCKEKNVQFYDGNCVNDKYLTYLNEKNIYENLLDVIKEEDIKKINFEKLFKKKRRKG